MDTFFHVMGVACLAAIAGIAAKIFAEAAGEYAKILATLRGTNIPPAASGAPHAPALFPQLRRVEAAAEPAIQVRP